MEKIQNPINQYYPGNEVQDKVWLFHTLYSVNVSNLCDHRIRGDSDGTLCIVNYYYQTDVSIRQHKTSAWVSKLEGCRETMHNPEWSFLPSLLRFGVIKEKERQLAI